MSGDRHSPSRKNDGPIKEIPRHLGIDFSCVSVTIVPSTGEPFSLHSPSHVSCTIGNTKKERREGERERERWRKKKTKKRREKKKLVEESVP